MRPWHYLQPNKGGELPHAFVCVDTETDQAEVSPGVVAHTLRFGWAVYQRTRVSGDWTAPEWFRFTTAVDFWSWVESRARPKVRLFVFAHNWSFDAPVLHTFTLLPSRGWKLVKAVIESPPVILAWRRETTTLEMLDTLNWWRMPLTKIGGSLGIPKLDMPALSASSEEWDTYARRDVEIIFIALRRWWAFIDQFDLGGFASTLAAQALRGFRHRYMEQKILIDSDARAIAVSRESLHGGRTEAFRIGRIEGPVYCLDINSMYPAVMETEFYPCQLVDVLDDVDLDELVGWLDSYCLVATVDVETKRNRFAYVRDDKLFFPVGRLTLALTTPDLVDAIAHGELRRIRRVAIYERAKLFRRFVSELYAERMKAKAAGNDVDVWLLKILLNSLYGKFAQHGERWDVVSVAPDESVRVWRELDVDTGRVYSFRQLSGVVQTKVREGESHDSFPAIASHVTAYARDRLWRLIVAAGQANIFYVDTDSLYCNVAASTALADECDAVRLGALKSEGVFDHMIIHGAKDYELPGKRVVKGVRARAEWISPCDVVQEQWSTLVGMLRSGQLDRPITRMIGKHLSRNYTKGIVGADGVVAPLLLRDW